MAKTPTTKQSQTTPATWQNRYSLASGNQAKLFKKFSNWYDSLYAVVGTQPAPWRSKVYLPILARQTWALVAKFLTIKPGFEVRVLDEDADEAELADRADKAQRKLEFDYENPYLDESIRDKLFAPLLDAVVTGTGLAKVPWVVKKNNRYERVIDKDGTVDLTQEKKTTKTVAYNDLDPVNIFNVFISPAATNLYGSPWIIIRDYKPLAELQKVNDDTGLVFYRNLDKLKDSATTDDNFQTYNISRNRLLSNATETDKTINMVTVFECYEGDQITTYAVGQDVESGWVKLRSQKNPYWHGKYPLVSFHVKNRPFSFWGEGIFEVTYRMQAAYNDVFNHFMDQWNLAENSMIIAPETSNVNNYVVEPGGTLTYSGDVAPTQFKHAAPDPKALSTIMTLMDQAIEGVTISQYAAGNPDSASDNTQGTATGILHLQEAAGDIISFMKGNFQQSITQVGRMWLSNNQQYLQSDTILNIDSKNGPEVVKISPKDLQGDLELVVDDASMEPTTPSEQQNAWNTWLAQLITLQSSANAQAAANPGSPPMFLDFSKIADTQSRKFGIKNFSGYLEAKPEVEAEPQLDENGQPVQAQIAGQPAQPGAPATQTGPKPPSLSISFKDLPPSGQIQAAAQDNIKLTPQDVGLDPVADQQTTDLANSLAQSGHLDPSMLQHLPQGQPPVADAPAPTAGPVEDPQKTGLIQSILNKMKGQ